ncbi:MAG: FeoA family protein [Eubacterium sp.]|nr:FeoA family protein [Eubacterium sp.]
MPLSMVEAGEAVKVTRVGGAPATKQRLADLGFVDGTQVDVVQSQNGNLIVKVKDSKLAITKEMANKIVVSPL